MTVSPWLQPFGKCTCRMYHICCDSNNPALMNFTAAESCEFIQDRSRQTDYVLFLQTMNCPVLNYPLSWKSLSTRSIYA
jgi:hypothetical protein